MSSRHRRARADAEHHARPDVGDRGLRRAALLFGWRRAFFRTPKTTVPAFAGTVDYLSKTYFFLAAFFLDAFFFAFFAFAAMIKLRSRVSPGTEYIHE